ncbi:WD-40 repeat-containing protein [Trametes coccinea BRFM310]|uniref:ASTRA-associated protein 1 n=1 Tax=Trametes coccinea (strain BRFM310) TaxID=1353009 RepID=A0A1Y2J2I9_TRAC3|nr:WD-40 repeat-containing protein [Trametes coccinea BRFM310]
MSPPPPPTPKHLIRSHATQVNVVYISDDNERVYSGDLSGTVVITSTRSLRAIASWKAHSEGLLGVQEWAGRIITHGRDNKLHVWEGVREPERTLGGSAALPGLQTPALCCSLDVNALNYCRFSLLPLPEAARTEERQALVAVPNLVESAHGDIWTLPGKQRLHAAIGKGGQDTPAADGRGVLNARGIIMSMHLSSVPHPHAADRARLRLLCGYENGSVTMWGYVRDDKEISIEGIGWEALWTVRLHVESVMAMAVSPDGSFALSVSADHLIGRYNLSEAESAAEPKDACTVSRTKHPGNGSIAIKDDCRVCAVGGWDGRIRLYSTKSFRPLGTLAYHKKNCQSLAFAHPQLRPRANSPVEQSGDRDDDDEDNMTEQEKKERTRWLISGGQDSRVAIWSLMEFGKA